MPMSLEAIQEAKSWQQSPMFTAPSSAAYVELGNKYINLKKLFV